MTKEEIKTVIELFISWNGETEVIDVANLDMAVEFIANCFNLRDNDLNEAAEEYSKNFSQYFREGVKEIFKEGAKWTEGQGEPAEINYWNHRGLSIRLDKPLEKLGYEEGDKVVVQIRKVSN